MMAPANEGVSVLANVRLGDEAADIVMQDGHISGIAPGLADATPTAMRSKAMVRWRYRDWSMATCISIRR